MAGFKGLNFNSKIKDEYYITLKYLLASSANQNL